MRAVHFATEAARRQLGGTRGAHSCAFAKSGMRTYTEAVPFPMRLVSIYSPPAVQCVIYLLDFVVIYHSTEFTKMISVNVVLTRWKIISTELSYAKRAFPNIRPVSSETGQSVCVCIFAYKYIGYKRRVRIEFVFYGTRLCAKPRRQSYNFSQRHMLLLM